MAETFLVNAAYALSNDLESVEEFFDPPRRYRLQSVVESFTPLSWTINGYRYPDTSRRVASY